MGSPYVNPQIAPSQYQAVSFPIHNPATGVRPAIRTTSEDQQISAHEAAAMQDCSECDQHSTTRRCPRYRKLGNQGGKHRNSTYVTNTCCNAGCHRPLCGLHMHPHTRDTDDMRLKFCSEYIKMRPRCTSCGGVGIDKWYNKNKENNGKTYHRNREESLWPCGKGCYNLLCRKCGATQDGCDLHRRQFGCSIWYSHWAYRRFEGPLGSGLRDGAVT